MTGHRTPRPGVIIIPHDEIVRYSLDYTLGRLDEDTAAAFEAHMRTCPVCRRQGLHRAPTLKREAARKYQTLRPARVQRHPVLRRLWLLVAIVPIVAIVALSYMHGDAFWVASLIGVSVPNNPGQVNLADNVPAVLTPAPLKASLRYESGSMQDVALAVSPDGTLLAASGIRSGAPSVLLYDAVSGHVQARLQWTGSKPPIAFSWSATGRLLAASDGTTLGIWVVATRTLALSAPMSDQAGLHVYSALTGALIQSFDPKAALRGGALLGWGADGELIAAPSGAAGPSGIATPQSTLVGVWRISGSRLSLDTSNAVRVGNDTNARLLDWSPDGRYVLWGTMSLSVAMSTKANGDVPVPNLVVSAVASALQKAKKGNALLWFAPDGKSVAVCERTGVSSALWIYNVGTGTSHYGVNGVCNTLTAPTLAWMPSGRAFLLYTPGHAITEYPLLDGD